MVDNETLQKQILVEQKVTNEGKSIIVSYILWLFLGVFGAHRFYLGATGTAVAMLIISLTGFGLIITLIWSLVDAFLIPGMVRENHNQLRLKFSQELD